MQQVKDNFPTFSTVIKMLDEYSSSGLFATVMDEKDLIPAVNNFENPVCHLYNIFLSRFSVAYLLLELLQMYSRIY